MAGFTLQPIRCPMATRFDRCGQNHQKPSPSGHGGFPEPDAGVHSATRCVRSFRKEHLSNPRARWRDSLLRFKSHFSRESNGCLYLCVCPFPILNTPRVGHPRLIRGMLPSKNAHFERFAGAISQSIHLPNRSISGSRYSLRPTLLADLSIHNIAPN